MAGRQELRLVCLDRLNVRGGWALRALLGVVGHLRAFGERLKAAAGESMSDGRRGVLALIIGRDEAEALVVAEPLHGSGCDVFPRGEIVCCETREG